MLRLKELRESMGLSQKELSAKLGYAQNTLSNWENGIRTPDLETAGRLASFFGVSVDYLLGRIDEKTPVQKEDKRVSADDLKIALFGGDGEVTDEMWEEAQIAAQIIKERYKRKKESKD